MNGFSGVEQAVAAMAGGSATEEIAAAQERARLQRVLGQQERLEYQMERKRRERSNANVAETKETWLNNYISGADQNDPLVAAAIAGIADQVSNAEKARGLIQQSTARQVGLDALLAGENMTPDMQNRITAIATNAMLAPTNVRVDEQAQGNINRDQAYVDWRSKPSAAGGAAGGKVILPDWDDYAAAFGNSDLAKIEAPKFLAWQANKMASDPRYADGKFALGQYVLAKEQESAAPDVAGATPELTPEDQALINKYLNTGQ